MAWSCHVRAQVYMLLAWGSWVPSGARGSVAGPVFWVTTFSCCRQAKNNRTLHSSPHMPMAAWLGYDSCPPSHGAQSRLGSGSCCMEPGNQPLPASESQGAQQASSHCSCLHIPPGDGASRVAPRET